MLMNEPDDECCQWKHCNFFHKISVFFLENSSLFIQGYMLPLPYFPRKIHINPKYQPMYFEVLFLALKNDYEFQTQIEPRLNPKLGTSSSHSATWECAPNCMLSWLTISSREFPITPTFVTYEMKLHFAKYQMYYFA